MHIKKNTYCAIFLPTYSLTFSHKNKIKRHPKSLEGTTNAKMEEERKETEKRKPNCEG